MDILFGGMGHCTTRLQILKDMSRLASYEYIFLFPSKVLNIDTERYRFHVNMTKNEIGYTLYDWSSPLTAMGFLTPNEQMCKHKQCLF